MPYRPLFFAISAWIIGLHGVSGVAAESGESARLHFDIKAPTMNEALSQYIKQSGVQVVSWEDHVRDLPARKVKGLYSKQEALRLLTAHTRLCFAFQDDDHATVDWCSTPQPSSQRGSFSKSPPTLDRTPQALLEIAATTDLQSVTVTGTHIPRHNSELQTGPEPIVLTHEDLLRLGVISLADLDHVLPQLFGGGPSQDTHLIGAAARTNTGLGCAYNLRGQGAGATLLLLNGRRLAPSGSTGSFFDCLNIPLSAIKRVEFLTDGVSAIYGADAVSGVINIITRDSDDRGETTALVSDVTQGAWKEANASQSLSTDWQSGGAFGSIMYSKSTALPERDRRFGGSDLRAYGGPNLDLPQSFPPTIVVGKQVWAAPPGLTVGIPTATQLHFGAQNLEDVHSDSDLWPSQEITSAYGEAHYDLGHHISIRAEGMLTHRGAEEAEGGDRVNLSIPTSSPYYLSSIAQGSPMTVQTDLFDALGPEVTHVDVRMIYGALVMTVPLGSDPDNKVTVSTSRALETEHQNTTGVGKTSALADPTYGFDPFVVASALSAKTLTDIRGSSFFNQASELHEYNILWTGPIAAHDDDDKHAHAEKIMGAIGLEYRTQSLNTSDSGISGVYDRYNRRTKAVYAEVTVPLLGHSEVPDSSILELSAAGRYEDYSDFGHATVPRVALRWVISADLKFQASLGRSLRTPNLPDLNTSRNTIIVGPPPSGVGQVIYLSGNDPRLEEETATNAALEAVFTHQISEGTSVRLDAQLFSIYYYGRIEAPDLSEIGPNLLTSSLYSSLLLERNPSAATVAQLCQSSQLYGTTPAKCLQGNYLAVVDLRLKNSDTLVTRGIDIENTWTTHPSWGTVELKGLGTYLFRYAEKSTPSASTVSLLNTQNNPINLQAHATLSVASHGIAADVTTNFSNSYRDTVSQPNRSVSSWTTIDLRVRYVFNQQDDPSRYGWVIELGAQNVTNRDPPFLVNYVERLGYDEENADPLGRIVTLRFRKQW